MNFTIFIDFCLNRTSRKTFFMSRHKNSIFKAKNKKIPITYTSN